MRVFFLLVLLATAAHADDAKTTLATGMQIEESTVIETQEFALEAGDYHRVVAGHWRTGEKSIGGVALVWCGKKDCWIAREWFGYADSVEILGLIDLGTPSKLPVNPRSKYAWGPMKLEKAKWPALVVRFTTREETESQSRYGGRAVAGVHHRTEISVLSLAPEDHAHPQILQKLQDERWPTGSGVTVTFEVGKNSEIVASAQRHLENVSLCIPPPPTITTYVFENEHRRYVERSNLERRGCR